MTLPDRKVAAKTGTTNGFKDNYTMGYTPQLTVGVWVGNTDNESMENVTGLSGAAPIWNAVMRKYHEGLPAIWYDRPPGIVDRADLPAKRPAAHARTARTSASEIFVAGTEPTISDNIWQAFDIDRETGLLAGPTTPPDRIEKRVFQILPREAADWVRESGLAQPPTEKHSGRPEDFDPDSAIISPTVGSYIARPVGRHRQCAWRPLQTGDRRRARTNRMDADRRRARRRSAERCVAAPGHDGLRRRPLHPAPDGQSRRRAQGDHHPGDDRQHAAHDRGDRSQSRIGST